jgi:phosphoketolase
MAGTLDAAFSDIARIQAGARENHDSVPKQWPVMCFGHRKAGRDQR